mgnify:CR=1 FL=1
MRLVVAVALAAVTVWLPTDQVSDGNYQMIEDWITGPEDIGGVSGVTTDDEGNIYAFRRNANNVWNLDAAGKLVKEWGQDIAIWTHSIRVDHEGYIWTVDGQGHQIKKWSPDASELLMTLGEYDVAGDGPDTFNRPTDVAVASNGDFFVSDGYVNTRVAKFDKSGEFIKDWGGGGTAPGQFDTVHSITIDSRDRVLVADRGNSRVQIFDLEGNFNPAFLDSFKSLTKKNNENSKVVFVSMKGDISSILANGFVEQLGYNKIYSLQGGIQEWLKLNNSLIK